MPRNVEIDFNNARHLARSAMPQGCVISYWYIVKTQRNNTQKKPFTMFSRVDPMRCYMLCFIRRNDLSNIYDIIRMRVLRIGIVIYNT